MTALLLALPAHAADPARGQSLLADRATSQCALCHPIPGMPAHLQGDLGPDLRGIASRLSRAFDGRHVDVLLKAPNLQEQAIHRVASHQGVPL